MDQLIGQYGLLGAVIVGGCAVFAAAEFATRMHTLTLAGQHICIC